MSKGDSLEKRFWGKVDKTGACWVWKSALTTRGYGFFWVGGEKRSEYAHRVSWSITNGRPVPLGMVVMHSCDNPACVNPEHLSIGTAQDNRDDCTNKKRHAFGMKNGGGAKLDDEKAKRIRDRTDGLSITKTASLYGVCVQVVKRIRRGKLWSHV